MTVCCVSLLKNHFQVCKARRVYSHRIFYDKYHHCLLRQPRTSQAETHPLIVCVTINVREGVYVRMLRERFHANHDAYEKRRLVMEYVRNTGPLSISLLLRFINLLQELQYICQYSNKHDVLYRNIQI